MSCDENQRSNKKWKRKKSNNDYWKQQLLNIFEKRNKNFIVDNITNEKTNKNLTFKSMLKENI